MQHGELRVFLGAAPGVGKTYRMLDEGRRLAGEGKDVVAAVVETHGRSATATMVEGFEVIPRIEVSHRGVLLAEMDLEAVLKRHPDVALVDEFAHTNAPGLVHEKRWQDVQTLLDAGIDVLTTVNIQHLESLNDVVQQITGVPQRETIPDEVVRAADHIDLVDLAPQVLRDRLAEGRVYPADRIDAALSNYFRTGNLTALRELALLWLADQVDAALENYRSEHHIDSKWETRERVVVALPGGLEGETLLRRGARIAERSSGGELLAVHVTSHDGLRHGPPGALVKQRSLVERLGGSYHQVVGDDIPEALVSFAKSVNATQLVIGVSRRGRLQAMLTGQGTGATIIREAGSIDVHIVNHAGAAAQHHLPRFSGSLTLRRKLLGFLIALGATPLLTLLLEALPRDTSLTAEALSYQLLAILVALIGGIWPALLAATLSGLAINYFFIAPQGQFAISDPIYYSTLVMYIVNAILVSVVVDQEARRRREARRTAAEAEFLITISGSVLRGQDALQTLIDRTKEAFGLDAVRLVATQQRGPDEDIRPPATRPIPTSTILCTTGETRAGATPSTEIEVGDKAILDLYGPELDSSGQRLLAVIATQINVVLENQVLSKTANEVGSLTKIDQVRNALLSAVSHDLRRPLAAAMTAVSSLGDKSIDWSISDRDELLDTARESLDTLTELVSNLLDVTRLQAGALAISLRPTFVEDTIIAALDELKTGPQEVELDLRPDIGPVLADRGLLQRVIVNVLSNAIRFTPPNTPVRVSTSRLSNTAEIRVVDHGPGLTRDRKEKIFVPFQRLGDTDNLTGLGLGLAIANGFTEGMGGTLTVEDTPGGGLTMVIALPCVRRVTSLPQETP